jgi:hypothetical protein
MKKISNREMRCFIIAEINGVFARSSATKQSRFSKDEIAALPSVARNDGFMELPS